MKNGESDEAGAELVLDMMNDERAAWNFWRVEREKRLGQEGETRGDREEALLLMCGQSSHGTHTLAPYSQLATIAAFYNLRFLLSPSLDTRHSLAIAIGVEYLPPQMIKYPVRTHIQIKPSSE